MALILLIACFLERHGKGDMGQSGIFSFVIILFRHLHVGDILFTIEVTSFPFILRCTISSLPRKTSSDHTKLDRFRTCF